MKKIMKVVSLVLTFALLVSMVTIVSAGPESGSGTITINPPSGVSLAGQTYTAYRILDADVNMDVEIGDADENHKHAITYKLIENGTIKGDIATALKAADSEYCTSSGITDAASLDIGKVTAAIKALEEPGSQSDTKLQKFAESMLSSIESHSESYSDYKYEGSFSGGRVTISDLPYGYYLVDNTDKGSLGSFAAVALTSTDPTAAITAKVYQPTLEKKVEGASANTANIGDKVTFTLNSKVPNTIGYESYTFKITDQLSTGLDYIEPSDVNESTITAADLIKLEVKKDASSAAVVTLNSTQLSRYVTYTEAEDKLEIDLSDIIMNWSSKAASDANNYTGYDIVITYKAIIGNDAPLTGMTNKAELQYSNDPTTTTTGKTEETETKTYTFELDISKVCETHTTALLPGAKFKIKRNSDNQYLVVTGNNVNGYVVSDWDASGTVMDTGEKDTGDNVGKIKIKGLKAGTYTLIETEPPTGYSKIGDGQIEFEITTKYDTGGKTLQELGVTINNNSAAVLLGSNKGTASTGIAELTVENREGSTLPETGGMGTTILYTLGGALVVIAGVLLITKKRMSVTR